MLDQRTVLALRDAVRIEERGIGCRVLIGDALVFKFPGCGNQHANTLAANLRAALAEVAAAQGEGKSVGDVPHAGA